MRNRNNKKQLAEINVVPYIDVMLVLLIIFMVTTPLLSQGVHVDLPKAQAQALDNKPPEPLIVSIDAQGNYYLNTSSDPDKPLTNDELSMQVKQQLTNTSTASNAENGQSVNNNEKRQILVKGDKNVDYGKVVQAMVILQQAGAPSVGLMTQTEDDSKK